MLGHYLAKWDGGEFAREILASDLYVATMNRSGGLIADRAMGKTVILAVLFGAGPPRLAKIIKGTKDQAQRLLDRLFANVPALKKLREIVSDAFAKPGYLPALDGGRLQLRNDYLALNTLLQGAEAVAMKWATVELFHMALRRGLRFGIEWALVGYFHDELQMLARPEHAELLGRLAARAIERAGEHFKLRIPLAGEFKIGRNWRETH
jgi:DNA polymerase I-like protein with 3'-5' exonuclease and polymerase domains